MITAIQSLIHPKVMDLKPYLPGKSIKEIQQKYQIENVIKLASNENAWGCSPHALKAIQNTHMDDISFYPNTYLHPFFNQLREHLNISDSNLFLANGSDAIFSLLIQAYALPHNKQTLTHQYAFMGYEIQSKTFGINCLKIEVDPLNWHYKLTDLISYSHFNVAIIFLSNPNNPTGQKISWDEIEKLLKHIPKKCLVVIDEAYYEYNDEPHPDLNFLLTNYPQLIITRTLSKAYGLASLRLGYAIAHQEIISTLKKIQLPFTINQMALNAGFAALNDQDFIKNTVLNTKTGKAFLEAELNKMPIKLHFCHGNFVTIELQEEALKLVNFLESNGIIIRPLNAFGLNHCVRITVGRQEQNEQLIQLMNSYFK